MVEKAKQRLKEKGLDLVFNSSEYSEILAKVCKDISSLCLQADNEATVGSIFELEMFGFIEEVLGLKYRPEKEKTVSTVRHIAKGRIDSKIGSLVLEFKQRSSYESASKKDKALKQIKEYLEGVFEEYPADYIGFVTDGVECQMVSFERGEMIVGPQENLSIEYLDTLIKNIVLLDKVALTPENLVKDFCSDESDGIARKLTIELYKTLSHHATDKTQMLFSEWKELFRLAHDDKSKQKAIQERKKALEKVVGENFSDTDEEYMSLYALQTAYAIIVKIIAYKVISKIRFNESLINFETLAKSDLESLMYQMNRLEEGEIFRSLGIGNLLEGDFFAWYSSGQQWNEQIGGYIKEIFATLTPYEDKAQFDSPENVNDLFKDLYMSIMPDKVRHSLGEFYTPPWLADHLIENTLSIIKNSSWRGLDPCSGSGTFLTVLIRKVLEETKGKTNSERLNAVLHRVKGIDLNPLAVLTARINYFINISPLINVDDKFEIPVYLGDSSYVPEQVNVGAVECLSYKVQTIKGEIEILLPRSVVSDVDVFSKTMTLIEDDIHALDEESIADKLLALTPDHEKLPEIVESIKNLASKFVELERNDWNGIWARIVTNFLTTANLGKFDAIVGNPPWIDWKNLPAGYRDRVKGLCIDRKLFSGDGQTGGINLNICALISSVCAQNWLSYKGTLGFLMPQSIIFQQSYEGFRKFELDDGNSLFLQEIHDWTSAGHPFKPVQHKFLSYFYSRNVQDYRKGICAKHFIKNQNEPLDRYRNKVDYQDVAHLFTIKKGYIGQASTANTIFSYANTKKELNSFKKVSGGTDYIGREGVEFYPQELFLLTVDGSKPSPNKGSVFLKNFQSSKSKYKIPPQITLLETEYLHPLVRGRDIQRFNINDSGFVVPFPYDKKNTRAPMSIKELTDNSKLLARYLRQYRRTLELQTQYNSKIIGEKNNSEFYALARVGEYSFAEHYVVFRDNSKWVSAVVSKLNTPWGEMKRPQFQNHAVSISQDSNGNFISLQEAHYICAVFNAPIIAKFILNSSDSRTFKIRPQINIPKFDKTNKVHLRLSELSIHAHQKFGDELEMEKVDIELDELVLKLRARKV
jgi:hypothetical protein